MGALLHSEWIKLRTVTSHVVLVILALAFPLVLSLLIVALTGVENVSDDLLIGSLAGAGVLSGLLVGVIGVLSFAQEQSHGTLRVTFAATPRRLQVLVAKALMTIFFGAGLAVVVLAVGTVIGSAILSARDAENAFYPAVALSSVVFTVLLALLGLALGMLTRNTPVAIVLLIAWPLLIENLIGGLLSLVIDDVFRFMPFFGAINSLAVESSGEGFGRVGGLAYLGVWVLGLLVLGALMTEKRDT
jgi:ABC-2 type transport system permease protein